MLCRNIERRCINIPRGQNGVFKGLDYLMLKKCLHRSSPYYNILRKFCTWLVKRKRKIPAVSSKMIKKGKRARY